MKRSSRRAQHEKLSCQRIKNQINKFVVKAMSAESIANNQKCCRLKLSLLNWKGKQKSQRILLQKKTQTTIVNEKMNFLVKIHIGLLLCGLLAEAARIFGEFCFRKKRCAQGSNTWSDFYADCMWLFPAYLCIGNVITIKRKKRSQNVRNQNFMPVDNGEN